MQNDGYVKSSDYADLYFDMLNPHFINLNLLLAGFKPTRCRDYLELGFGMGRSLITHAVSNVGNFIGTDFSKSQVAFAEKIRQKARISNLTLYDDSFEELLERFRKMRASGEEVGFDFIVLHGIYSWINYENRQIILSIIEEFLRDGGVVYISYNCLPGRAKAMDARHIFKQYSKNQNTENFEEIFEWTQNFAKLGLRQEKEILDNVEELKQMPSVYLAHEFLNDSWYLPYFSDVAQAMQKRGLQWACEDVLSHRFKRFKPEEERFLKELKGKIFKEQMKDFIIDKDFRYDLYVKNPSKLSKKEWQNAFLELSFTLIDYPSVELFKDCDKQLKMTYAQLISKLESDDFAPKKAKNLFFKEFDFDTNAHFLCNLILAHLVAYCANGGGGGEYKNIILQPLHRAKRCTKRCRFSGTLWVGGKDKCCGSAIFKGVFGGSGAKNAV